MEHSIGLEPLPNVTKVVLYQLSYRMHKYSIYIKGIPKNSQVKLADLVYPQQDGIFCAAREIRTLDVLRGRQVQSTTMRLLHGEGQVIYTFKGLPQTHVKQTGFEPIPTPLQGTFSPIKLSLHFRASEGNRTLIPRLEVWRTSRCATLANCGDNW